MAEIFADACQQIITLDIHEVEASDDGAFDERIFFSGLIVDGDAFDFWFDEFIKIEQEIILQFEILTYDIPFLFTDIINKLA
ncbi:hypothetical protein GW864_02600 [bacterium]|nr:hypothetical protein [bacterium]